MKKIILLLLMLFVFAGCSSVQIPAYIQEKKPFNQRFYAGYPRVVAACQQALLDLGWVVEKEVAPQVFEVVSADSPEGENILLVTETRETRMILGTRYARMNIYVRSKGDISDVEVRYMVITDLFLYKPKVFGDEAFAQRFFSRMQLHLGE